MGRRVDHMRFQVIDGGRTQLEREAVAALMDPARFHLASDLFARLERRGRLRLVSGREFGLLISFDRSC